MSDETEPQETSQPISLTDYERRTTRSLPHRRESTRAGLAIGLLALFIASILVPVIMEIAGILTFAESLQLITRLASIVGGPLGFALGYYFKSTE